MNIELLNHWGDLFLNLAWPILWQSSLLIAIVFFLDFALRRKIRAAIRYAIWLIVLVKLLLPPSLALPTSVAWWLLPSPQSPPMPQPAAYVVTYGNQIVPTLPLLSGPIPPPIQPKMSSAAWSLAASGVVSAGLLAWLLVRWRQINQKVRRAAASEKLIPILDEARRLTRLRPGLRLKLTEDSMSPAVCGLFRPVILLPQSLVEKLSAGQLRAVLLHEAIHLRRGDVWVNCAQALMQIFYWWHPLLWLANARIRRVREEAVDDAVMLALRDDAEIYAPTLLEVAKLAFNRPLASLGLVGILESRSALRQRIERLMNFRAPRKAGLTVVSILGILAFSAVALPMGEAPEQTNAPTASAFNSTNTATASDIITNTVTGILSDTNFRAAIHALQQRTGVETLAEPEPVTTAGQGANQINRMVVSDKINIPTLTTNAAESGNLVQDGKLLYEIGRFDDAETKLKAALTLNPDNQAAQYYLNLVEKSRRAPKSQEPKMIYPDWDSSPAKFNSSSERIQNITSRREIMSALGGIHWSNVYYDKVPLGRVIAGLNNEITKHDRMAISFLTDQTTSSNGLVGTAVITIEPPLANARLLDLLDDIVRGADRPIKYAIEDDDVAFSWKDQTTPLLEMRVFKVDPVTFPASFLGLQTNNVSTNAINAINPKILSRKMGVDLTASGRSIAYGDRLGLLFVRATPSELDTVERAIQALNMIPPQIHIKARFIEVPKNGFVMPQLFSNAVAGPMTGILSDPEFRTVLRALEQRQGVETLAEPECVTTSGRQTQMRATSTQMILTNFVPQESLTNSSSIVSQTGKVKIGSVVPQIGKFETGPTLDVVPWVLSDGYTINLTTIAQVLEFLGYDKATNTVYATNSTGQTVSWPMPRPGFRIQHAKAIVNLWDNQTLVLGNLKSDFGGGAGQIQNESKFFQDAEKKNGAADKELLVFITATIVDPAGNRVHTDNELPFNPSTIPPQPKISTPSP